MNKNKKNKLTIKENWSKGLTISDNQMNIVKGGLQESVHKQGCTACGGAGETAKSDDYGCIKTV